MFDQDFILVQEWDPLTGSWMDFDEAQNQADAEKIVRQLQAADNGDERTYSIYTVKRVLFGRQAG